MDVRHTPYVNDHPDGMLVEVAAGLPYEYALRMVADGRIADGKTVALLQWAALSGPFRR